MKLFQKRQPQQAAKDPLLEELEAEYRNYRRRTALELEQANDAATRRAVLNFLPLYDDLERAPSALSGRGVPPRH
ncbi:protein GrpE [Firmicutes bacterium CAG:170]|nr:protein GrpE [Firmicutes bacterium CAG:170]